MRFLATYDGAVVCFEVVDAYAYGSSLILRKNVPAQSAITFPCLFNLRSYVQQLFESGKLDLTGCSMRGDHVEG